MTSTTHQGALSAARVRRAAEGFDAYCDKELALRQNGDEPFDQEAFEAARDLVKRSLDNFVNGATQNESGGGHDH